MDDITRTEKRRSENWILTIVFLVSLVGAVVFMITPVKLFIGTQPSMEISSLTLRLGSVSLFLLIICYVFQNEIRNRKLSRLMMEDRVSLGVLDRRISELTELNRVSEAVASVMDIDTLYGIIMDSALRLTNADNFSLLIKDNGSLRIKVSRGLDVFIARSTKVNMGEGIAGWVAERGEPVILNGAVSNGRFRNLVSHEKPILSSLSVPVKLRESVIGVMCVSNVTRKYSFTENDLRLLSIFSDQVAIALENNRLVMRLKRSLEDLQRGQEKILQSAKLSALGQLISGITHELNNRLSPIIAYSELLRDQYRGGEADRYVGNVYRSALGARKLLRSLSSFSKERKPTMEYVDLNEIMGKVLGMMAYQLKVSDIQVEREMEAGISRTMADPFQMEEVFFNIVKNALLSICSSPSRLKVRSYSLDGKIVFEVSDSGVGMPREHLTRIFDPFFTTRRGDEGTGLGLSISYGIIKVHGGDISVSSREGEGTTVRVELPVKERTCGVSPAARRKGAASRPSSLRVLVVDDEEIVRELVYDILSKENDVETAGTVKEAMGMIDNGEFDIVIADYRMPKVDGIQFYRSVSEMKPSLKNRILFVTGDANNWKIKDFIRETGNMCISKPFSVNELFEACLTLVEQTS